VPYRSAVPDVPLARLRALVTGDDDLRATILRHDGGADFPAFLAALAADHGIDLPPEAVEDAVRQARRAWIERGV
jgi:hypothetical protein